MKEILFSQEAQRAILSGTTKLSDAVRITLSSKGQNVVIEEGMAPPKIINDGVSIAKAIQFKDHYENVGALLMIQAAEKTNQTAGDGTTTAIILAQEIYKEGLKHLISGRNQMSIKNGIKIAVERVIKELKRIAKPIKRFDDIKNIATVSSGDKELGRVIAESIDAVGKDGVVTVEEWSGFRLEKEIVKGTQIARGFVAPHFVTNEKNYNATYKNPLFFITSHSLENVDHIFGAMKVAKENNRPLVVIAPDIRAQALYTLVINKLNGQQSSLAIQSPGAGDEQEEELEDLAALVGATCVSEKTGIELDKIELKHLGSADKIISDKNTTTIIEGHGKKSVIQKRINALKNLLKDPSSQYQKEHYRSRLGKLTGKVAVIKVGAPTTPEIEDKKLKLEDALNATRSAIDEGIVPGGGKALYLAKNCLTKIKLTEDEQIGVDIVHQAIQAPIQQVITNSGKSVDRYLVQIENSPMNFGFNSDTCIVEDLLKAGVVDPLKVVRCALENAGSVSAMLLTTNAVIVTANEEEK
jgi:chaperonin GroEL